MNKYLLLLLIAVVCVTICDGAPNGQRRRARRERDESLDELLSEAKERSGRKEPVTARGGKFKVVEGDLMVEDVDVQTGGVESEGRSKRAATSNLWPNQGSSVIVPYAFSSNVPLATQVKFAEAVGWYDDYTCIQFVPHTNQQDYIRVEALNQGCYSYLGRIGGDQELNLQSNGCNYLRIIVHELAHAIGIVHEQSQTNRDSFVEILWGNIQSGRERNFQKRSGIDAEGTPYDYRSVMHYGRTAFTKNGQNTIRTLDPAFQFVIGTAPTLSYFDIELINKAYNCPAINNCPNTNCGSGFLAHDCQCYCNSNDPGSPITLCGTVLG